MSAVKDGESGHTYCDEGCGCFLPSAGAVRATVNGRRYLFCCEGCADSFRGLLSSSVEKLVSRLVRKGDCVADLGCGNGVYTVELARRVGPSGRVFASDPDAARRRAVRHFVRRRGFSRRVVVVAPKSGRFPTISAGSLSFVLSNDVLCCTSRRREALAEIYRVLASGGSAVVRVGAVSSPRIRPISAGEWRSILRPYSHRELPSGYRGARLALLRKPRRPIVSAGSGKRGTREGTGP